MVDWTKLDIDKLDQKIAYKNNLIPQFEEHLAEALAIEEWAITELAIENAKLAKKIFRKKKKKKLGDFIRTTPIIESNVMKERFVDVLCLEQKLVDIKRDIQLLNDDAIRFCQANIDKCEEKITELKTINKSSDNSELKNSNKSEINNLNFNINKFKKLMNYYKVPANG